MPVTHQTKSKPKSKSGKDKPVIAQKPKSLGWNTTDEDEIALRRFRGETEPLKVQPLELKYPYFATFSVQSPSNKSYCVEIRDLTELVNSCDCQDYQHNGLGTCKHIEHVLWRLQKSGKNKFRQAVMAGSSRIEIYLQTRDQQKIISVQWPKSISERDSGKRLLEPFFSTNTQLMGEPLDVWPKLLQALTATRPLVRSNIRVSKTIETFIQAEKHQKQRQNNKEIFLRDIQEGKRGLSTVKLPLYPYQQEGMLHLALNERALLCDEMGLGKTIQAISACELLRRNRGIKSVLVVCTASLKAEWEEQIKKFVDLPSLIICGERANRLQQYQQSTFFYLTNYEQIISDAADIQRLLAPDVIILDEAQRIKNWQTKTAQVIKQLKSRYAFVLTGTPLENRIDDIYSIVQFLNPQLFGPLFRFNREYYELNDKGKPVAYKNLDKLHQRLQPILLRRCKTDVENELPPCTVKEYFVEMTEEQRARYEEQEAQVSRIAKAAQRRHLFPDEFKRLQRHLACMRMLCDTPYILDEECRDCPKLIELEPILEELMLDPQVKIIIFSEWTRMLQLVRELVQRMGLGAAWHTGGVPQIQRREEINRFKQDPHCRIFLSSDSGSVGLNLQAANVVINLDLPWNPAKLAQRIARAWRKHQHRHVHVINLVTRNSIEHRMISMLNQKQLLAEGVLHGKGEASMKLPSGRNALMERINELLNDHHESSPPASSVTEKSPWVDPVERFKQFSHALVDKLPGEINLVSTAEANDQPPFIVSVVSNDMALVREPITELLNTHYPDNTPVLELLNQETYDTIQRLAQAGFLTLNPALRTVLGNHELIQQHQKQMAERQLLKARQTMAQTDRPFRLSKLLIDGEFYEEALAPLREAMELLLIAFAELVGMSEPIIDGHLSIEQIKQLIIENELLPVASTLITRLRHDATEVIGTQLQDSYRESQVLLAHIKQRFVC